MSKAMDPSHDMKSDTSITHHDPHHSIPHRYPTAQPSINLTPEQYERLFFQPSPTPAQATHRRDLSAQFANPTPLAVISFLMCISPTACFLIGFDGTTGTSPVALVGVYYLLGGLGLVVGGILEWILGNTFPCVVFFTFGGFWLSFGVLNDPAHMITQAFQGGSEAVDFNTGLMFYFIFWTLLVTIYWIGAWRTNLVFVEIVTGFWFNFMLLAVGYSKFGQGDIQSGTMMLKVGGGFGLAASVGGWYLAFGLIMEAVGMPFKVPFGDLSTRIGTGRSRKYRVRDEERHD